MNALVTINVSTKPFLLAKPEGAEPVTWGFQLKGDPKDLEYLAKQLGDGVAPLDWESQPLTIRSSRLDGIQDLSQVSEEVERFVAVLNGLLKLLRFSNAALTVSKIFGVNAAGEFCCSLAQSAGAVQVTVDDGQTITVYD